MRRIEVLFPEEVVLLCVGVLNQNKVVSDISISYSFRASRLLCRKK